MGRHRQRGDDGGDDPEPAWPGEPVYRAAAMACAGVVGGLLGAWLGGRLTYAAFGLGEPTSDEVWVNAIEFFANLFLVLAGVVVGHVAGACVAPVAAIAALRWDSVLHTALWLVVVQFIAVPIAVAAVLGLRPVFGSDLPGAIIGAAVVGCVAPTVARTLAVRIRGTAGVR